MKRRIRGQVKREFARNLQNILNDRGWSQSDLARKMWGSRADGSASGRDNICGYLAGNILPQPANMRLVCDALGVKESDLVPSGALMAELDEPASFTMTDMKDGMTWLTLDLKLPRNTALKIITLLPKTADG